MAEVTGIVSPGAFVNGSVAVRQTIYGGVSVGSHAVRELRFLPFSEFPETGMVDILYVDTTNDVSYYWDGAMYRSIRGDSSIDIIARTTAEWSQMTGYISKLGGIYIYTDYRMEEETPIPAIKIGDGKAYVVDLPFFDTGVTESDREFWNNKVSAKMSTSTAENLILYTNREG